MRKILKISNTPLSTYPHTANVAAFLWSDQKIYPWLLNYFIKLFGWDSCNMDYEDFWFLDCPALQYERLDRKIIVHKWGNYLSFIKDVINEEYYVYLCVKTSCIREYSHMNAPHDMMIYGYDDDKQIVYAADFFNQKYTFSIVPYNELENALEYSDRTYTHYWVFHDDIIMMKANYDDNNIFLPRRVKESLLDYINSAPSKYIYTRIRENTPSEMDKYLFGKDCYKILYSHLNYNLSTNDLIGTWKHSFHLMSEHKKIMCERIKYMGNNGYLLNWEEYFEKITLLANEQKICENLYIKYVVAKQKKELERILNKTKQIESIECDLLECIVNDIIE